MACNRTNLHFTQDPHVDGVLGLMCAHGGCEDAALRPKKRWPMFFWHYHFCNVALAAAKS
jgi:hypothetical protein